MDKLDSIVFVRLQRKCAEQDLRTAIPPVLQAIVTRCLAHDGHARYATARDVAQALIHWLANRAAQEMQ